MELSRTVTVTSESASVLLLDFGVILVYSDVLRHIRAQHICSDQKRCFLCCISFSEIKCLFFSAPNLESASLIQTTTLNAINPDYKICWTPLKCSFPLKLQLEKPSKPPQKERLVLMISVSLCLLLSKFL